MSAPVHRASTNGDRNGIFDAALLDAGVDDAGKIIWQRQVKIGLGKQARDRKPDHQQVGLRINGPSLIIMDFAP